MMKKSTDIQDLLDIMASLRDKDHGCPWDIEQDFQSIKPYTIEEAYEVADAIERGDFTDLCDELGDLLLQVVFHAQMAKEQNLFEFGDVIEAITEKMIRRHPHVFGDNQNMSAIDVKKQWDEIKSIEKSQRLERRRAQGLPDDTGTDLLDQVSRAMPANDEALKLQKKLAKVGFDWNNPSLVLDKMEEEISEMREAIAKKDQNSIADELGDLMFVLVNLGRHVGADAEMSLRGTNQKVRHRFAYIERELAKNGQTASDADLATMEKLWQDAKTRA